MIDEYEIYVFRNHVTRRIFCIIIAIDLVLIEFSLWTYHALTSNEIELKLFSAWKKCSMFQSIRECNSRVESKQSIFFTESTYSTQFVKLIIIHFNEFITFSHYEMQSFRIVQTNQTLCAQHFSEKIICLCGLTIFCSELHAYLQTNLLSERRKEFQKI